LCKREWSLTKKKEQEKGRNTNGQKTSFEKEGGGYPSLSWGNKVALVGVDTKSKKKHVEGGGVMATTLTKGRLARGETLFIEGLRKNHRNRNRNDKFGGKTPSRLKENEKKKKGLPRRRVGTKIVQGKSHKKAPTNTP